LAKIAIELEQALEQRAIRGAPGKTESSLLAKGEEWIVEDVVCTSGPHDRPFEEQHSWAALAVVVAGTFQYRSGAGQEFMAPGSLLLGNSGQSFECGHEHGAGDRCVAFRYAPEYFEQFVAEAGTRAPRSVFPTLRLPPLRELSPLIARACAGLLRPGDTPWNEIAIHLAARTVRIVCGVNAFQHDFAPSAVARVTTAVREIEHNHQESLTLEVLARETGLSPYHFLRVFERITGVTPHQYVRRLRLREAATRLATEPTKVLDIALDSGFADVSNFNRAFRTEFEVSPRIYRHQTNIQQTRTRMKTCSS
jgi:AraC family transcriptional regulator